jgi:hypothetical protein
VTRDELRALLVENGLARVANKLADLASPTVGISIRPADDESIRVGTSKIGGGPLAYTRHVSPDGETFFWPLPEVAGASGWHLLGYPYNLGGPTLVEVDLQSRGAGEDEQRTALSTYERMYEALAEVQKRWCLLLQVDSSEYAGMDWGGGGVLHFCIEHEALRRRDFSRVWLNLQLV